MNFIIVSTSVWHPRFLRRPRSKNCVQTVCEWRKLHRWRILLYIQTTILQMPTTAQTENPFNDNTLDLSYSCSSKELLIIPLEVSLRIEWYFQRKVLCILFRFKIDLSIYISYILIRNDRIGNSILFLCRSIDPQLAVIILCILTSGNPSLILRDMLF